MKPKISIIIPVYNRENVISKTLDSVLAQTFNEWECLIVDDHSTDSTWSALEKYASNDSRIRIFKNERTKGACGARNTGLIHAVSDLVQFFDSDDEMYPTLLQDLYSGFSDEFDVITCWTHIVNVDTKKVVDALEYVSIGRIHRDLLIGKTYVDTNCALMRRELISKIGGWSEDCPSFQEWDFHLRLSKYAKYTTLKKYLINYYVGGSDTISKSHFRWLVGMLYIIKKYQTDWMLRCPVNFLKRIYGFYIQLQLFKEDKRYVEIVDKYNHDIAAIFRIIILLIYTVKNR